MKAINLVIVSAAIILFSAASYSKDFKGKDNLHDKNLTVVKEDSKDNSQKVKPVEVKYIWKDMPSYDRYGNEITPRARKNMLQNSLSTKNNDSENNNITESREAK